MSQVSVYCGANLYNSYVCTIFIVMLILFILDSYKTPLAMSSITHAATVAVQRNLKQLFPNLIKRNSKTPICKYL